MAMTEREILVSDDQGIPWIKSNSGKRKITSPHEIRSFFERNGLLWADRNIVEESSLNDLNVEKLKEFYQKIFHKSFDYKQEFLEKKLEEMCLARYSKLNLAGLLLFGKNPSRLFSRCTD